MGSKGKKKRDQRLRCRDCKNYRGLEGFDSHGRCADCRKKNKKS
jgi:hypothetical protein